MNYLPIARTPLPYGRAAPPLIHSYRTNQLPI